MSNQTDNIEAISLKKMVTTGNISNRELARSFLRQVINFSLFPSATKIFTTLPTT